MWAGSIRRRRASNTSRRRATGWSTATAPPTRRWGKVRAANGHPEPYNVRYWQVDNEPWPMGSKNYGECVQQFAAAMRKVDPNIKIIANGSLSLFTDNYDTRPRLPGVEQDLARSVPGVVRLPRPAPLPQAGPLRCRRRRTASEAGCPRRTDRQVEEPATSRSSSANGTCKALIGARGFTRAARSTFTSGHRASGWRPRLSSCGMFRQRVGTTPS